jgi:uncharacterized protein (DUF433 family)
MNWRDHISTDPAVLAGKPAIKGTRLSVALLLDLMGQGWSEQKLLTNYPQLQVDDIRAALAFAAEHLQEDDYIVKGKASH